MRIRAAIWGALAGLSCLAVSACMTIQAATGRTMAEVQVNPNESRAEVETRLGRPTRTVTLPDGSAATMHAFVMTPLNAVRDESERASGTFAMALLDLASFGVVSANVADESQLQIYIQYDAAGHVACIDQIWPNRYFTHPEPGAAPCPPELRDALR